VPKKRFISEATLNKISKAIALVKVNRIMILFQSNQSKDPTRIVKNQPLIFMGDKIIVSNVLLSSIMTLTKIQGRKFHQERTHVVHMLQGQSTLVVRLSLLKMDQKQIKTNLQKEKG